MSITLEQFQRAVAERRRERTHGARKYDAELVAFAIAHASTGIEHGRSLHEVSKELGISMQTLQSWRRRELETASTPSRLRKVIVAEAQLSAAGALHDQTGLTLTTSSGHVVRGLSAEQVIALLRGLL